MDPASILPIVLVGLTGTYVLAVVASLVAGSNELARATKRWTYSRFIVCAPLTVAALFAASLIGGATQAHLTYTQRLVGVKIQSTLTAYLCDEGLSAAYGHNADAPDPAVLIDIDLPKLYDFVENIHLTWMVPLQGCISLGALVYILGWKSLLLGSLSLVVLLPLLLLVMGRISVRLTRVMNAKDARVALVTQVIKQVRQIKLAALQSSFRGRIAETREEELKRTQHVAISNAAMVGIVYLLPAALIFVCFESYYVANGRLTSDIVFPALAFFSNINRATAMLPRLIMTYQAAAISFKRLRTVLSFSVSNKLEPVTRASEVFSHPRVALLQCSLGAPNGSLFSQPILENCNIDLESGTLAVISGSIGSGKTTLLLSLVGYAAPLSGNVHVQGRVAYASQKPFLINGTIRENILFGLPFDGPFYQKVLDAVALGPDIRRLPNGDSTVLGGSAVTISGGQMSRVAVARAIYSRREVVVLDDPLAAIDGQVRQHIIDQVLGPKGILKDSIRVVTTSTDALITAADVLFIISQGTITEKRRSLADEQQTDIAESILVLATSPVGEVQALQQLPSTGIEGYGSLKIGTISQVTSTDLDSGSENTPLLKKAQGEAAGDSLSRKSVSFSTYLRFLRLCTLGGWLVVLLVAASSKLLDVVGIYFLKLALEESEDVGHTNKLIYYGLCGVSGALLSAVFVVVGYFLCLIPSSRRIHDDLTGGILESKFTFFDHIPFGQILSRFTNDINKIDSQVGTGLISIVAFGVTASSSILVILSTSFLSILYLLPVGIVYFMIQSHYLHACRQLRRIENDARGPILNVASEIQTGAAVILSYSCSNVFKERARTSIDNHTRAIIQLFSACLLLIIGAPPSTLGLVMNFVIQITVQFNTFVQTRSNLEADITSVERVWAYADQVPEEPNTGEIQPVSSWPLSPSVTFDSFTACYTPGGPACLTDINLTIEPGQHIAVVGRTGAGKSSFTMALLRALDQRAIQYGQIRIDGWDISQVNLTTLRRSIALVPQEPAAFTGTLRYNLDPEGRLSDTELLHVADVCHIRRLFNMDDAIDILDHPIFSGSGSLSQGQIQIIALARAILARTKIVVLDEAAAAMDPKTRNVVHDLIKHQFKGCTVIAITHHLDSVMEYDKILVLDNGRIADYDKPSILLHNKDSIFTQLMQQPELRRQ
ncbi:P-loop containing nucleoside triphosphate hydrolase protein [Fusarium oxysporum Fo47]|uniref:P-loop containing nucleoside triphosphate hydrolase protein n=1 Tax=Fusarium oxysporum Fo47 TaxID=660027 RepID=UPI002869B561|nr:P-loop containing nucleoside triphosphate hydrolase protein [Fusarium oxysporum Fo47]QKD59067.2 P-loop containing nucleoside triphosphate hydrolase protein [Fusarium oxysporum Fo47]